MSLTREAVEPDWADTQAGYFRDAAPGQQERRERLRAFDLDGDASAWVETMHRRVLAQHADRVTDRFYAELQRLPGFRSIMARGFDLQDLKHSQNRYLHDFGRDFGQPHYFESRRRVGMVHHQVGVPLALFIAAHRLLQQTLFEQIQQVIDDPDERDALQSVALKISMLDLSLAVETFHGLRVHNLTESLNLIGEREREHRRRADTDVLTGLASRAWVLETLDRALSERDSAGTPMCVAMVDLDYFKRINDGFGHVIGDEVLRGAARRIRRALRDTDMMGRYGGEEFLMVLHEASVQRAYEVAERVRRHIEESPLRVEGQSHQVTVSVGLAGARSGDTLIRLLKRADQALYRAKAQGRNQVCVDDDAAGG